MQKNFSHFYNVLGYKRLQECENSVFFHHGTAFRIMILIIFANPSAGTEWICTVET